MTGSFPSKKRNHSVRRKAGEKTGIRGQGSGIRKTRRRKPLFGSEAWVGFEGGEHYDFEHSGLVDGKAGDGVTDLGFAFCLPEDGRAGCVAPLPDLTDRK